ncbi:MAG TPA: hypothetical protein VG164_07220 [Trebonia sp.]|jgi:hypothetical protein|nr:hypothetical protein [Trebonia sp.]
MPTGEVECQMAGLAATAPRPAGGADGSYRLWAEVITMLEDLATLAPSAIVCAAFLVGVVMLLRREMAPKRRERRNSAPDAGDDALQTSHEHSEP